MPEVSRELVEEPRAIGPSLTGPFGPAWRGTATACSIHVRSLFPGSRLSVRGGRVGAARRTRRLGAGDGTRGRGARRAPARGGRLRGLRGAAARQGGRDLDRHVAPGARKDSTSDVV